MNSYAVGFAFSEDKESILLIRKKKPEWQKDFLNGVGGKIEPGESPAEAMNRECLEEAGLALKWIHRGVMTGNNMDGSRFECHIFYAYNDKIKNFIQTEDEELGIFDAGKIQNEKILANLYFLIPFGKFENGVGFMRLEYA